MEKHTWKDMNKAKFLKKLDVEDGLTDKIKFKKRQFEMLKNIKNNLSSQGKIVILTGCGHLQFFEENIKEAEFPFR